MSKVIRVVLSAAFVLSLSSGPALAQSKAGVVTNLEGTATATRRTLPQPVTLKFRDDVFQNDRIVTGDRSIARLLLGGKAVVTIRERSALTITEVPGKSTIDLASGKIALSVAHDRLRPGERVEVRTPNAVAAVRGTTFVVEVTYATAQLGGSGRGTPTSSFFWFTGAGTISWAGGQNIPLAAHLFAFGTGNQPPRHGQMTAAMEEQALAGLSLAGQNMAGGQNAAIDSAMGTTVATFGLGADLPSSGYPDWFNFVWNWRFPRPLPGGRESFGSQRSNEGSGFKPPPAVLIFGDRADASHLAEDLASSGHALTMNVRTLPVDLSSFGAIWQVSAFTPLTGDEQARLAEFLALGRGLHLTGERPCNPCNLLNRSLQDFVRSVVLGGAGIRVGGLGDFFFGPDPFNPGAVGNVTTDPNALTFFPADAPGGMDGVFEDNVLATAPNGTPVGAVWDSPSLAGNAGRLTLLMDSDWLLEDSPARRAIVENIQTFIDGPLTSVLALAGPLFQSANENLTAGSTFLQVLGYTLTSTGSEPLLGFSGTRLTVPGRFVDVTDSNVFTVGGFARVEDGAEIVQTAWHEPLVSVSGGILAVGAGGDGNLFDLRGRTDQTGIDPYTGLAIGTDRPLQPGPGSPAFSATDDAVVVVRGNAFRVDTALLAATAPLLAMASGASMTTGAHVVDLVASAKIALANDAVALVNLDRGALTVLNGHLVNVAGGSSLYVAGSLVALANGSALNVLNGLLLNVAGGSSASIGGSLVNFTGAGNIVNVSNTLVPTAIIAGIPVSGPVGAFNIGGLSALTSGTGSGTILVNGVALTPATPLSSLTGSLVAVQTGGTVKVGN